MINIIQHYRPHKHITGLILGLRPASERRRYKVTPSLIINIENINLDIFKLLRPSDIYGRLWINPIKHDIEYNS